MENKRKIHQKRVERKGRCSKESHVIGEKVLVQNVVTKLWDIEAVVTGIRTAADKTIVSYNLDIGAYKVQGTENALEGLWTYRIMMKLL